MALVHDDADAAAVPDHLLCPVCLEAPPARIEQCHAGHLICALSGGEPSCLAKLRARAAANGVAARCPVCRAPLPADMPRCLAAEQSIALLPATCGHCEEGTTRGGLVAHEASCASAPNVGCKAVKGCAWEGRASDRAAHEIECTLVDLNRGRPGDGVTQLCIAAAKGDVDVVAWLIAAGRTSIRPRAMQPRRCTSHPRMATWMWRSSLLRRGRTSTKLAFMAPPRCSSHLCLGS